MIQIVKFINGVRFVECAQYKSKSDQWVSDCWINSDTNELTEEGFYSIEGFEYWPIFSDTLYRANYRATEPAQTNNKQTNKQGARDND